MTQEKMTLVRLQEILAAYGAKSDRWPADERAAAVRFLERNRQAQKFIAEAQKLDTSLDKLPEPAPMGAALYARFLRIPKKTDNITFLFQWLLSPKRLIPQAAGLVLAVFLGVMAGLNGALEEDGDLSAYIFGTETRTAADWDLEGVDQ